MKIIPDFFFWYHFLKNIGVEHCTRLSEKATLIRFNVLLLVLLLLYLYGIVSMFYLQIIGGAIIYFASFLGVLLNFVFNHTGFIKFSKIFFVVKLFFSTYIVALFDISDTLIFLVISGIVGLLFLSFILMVFEYKKEQKLWMFFVIILFLHLLFYHLAFDLNDSEKEILANFHLPFKLALVAVFIGFVLINLIFRNNIYHYEQQLTAHNLTLQASKTELEKLVEDKTKSLHQQNLELKRHGEKLETLLHQQEILNQRISVKSANLKALVDNIEAQIFYVNPENHIIEYNKVGLDYFQSLNPEFPDKERNAENILPQDHIEEFKQGIGQALKGEQVKTRELREDGSQIWDIFFIPVKEENGEILGVIYWAENITDREIARRHLITSERRFRAVSEVSTSAMWDYDIKSDTLDWFSGFNYYSKFIKDNTEPLQAWYDAIHPDDLPRVFGNFEKCVAEGLDFEDEYRIIDFEGNVRFISDRGVIFRDEDGIPDHVIGGMTDISHQVKKQLELEHSLDTQQKLIHQLEIREEKLSQNEHKLKMLNQELQELLQDAREKELFLNRSEKIAQLGSWQLNSEKQKVKFSDNLYHLHDVPKDITDKDVISIIDIIFQKPYKKAFYKFINDLENGKSQGMIITKAKGKEGFSHLFKVVAFSENLNGTIMINGITQEITREYQQELELKKSAVELAEMNHRVSEYKLMALRSTMNPHFIFNSLNSIQFFITQNDKKNAINYLSTFAQLIRGVLNSSVQNKIPLNEEINLIRYYIELEKVRFDQPFEDIWQIDQNLNINEIDIPSMLIQPYVENAIIHGLYNRKTPGKLMIGIQQQDDETLQVIVEDNGIGREAAIRIKNKSVGAAKSFGMKMTQERIAMINKNKDVNVEVIDLYKNKISTGTRVVIHLNLS